MRGAIELNSEDTLLSLHSLSIKTSGKIVLDDESSPWDNFQGDQRNLVGE